MKVGAEVWQFNVDYPGLGGSDDSKLPISFVSVKAWDEQYWMSRFDGHAAAISGPQAIAKLVNTYRAQGISLHLWCVPKGRNVTAMLNLAKACIDTAGVHSLTFDVEPYAGFCNADCGYLAGTLMKQLRAARPAAVLGVTYDPRSQHWDRSGTREWLKYADFASPMVYWRSFAGQGVWAAPESAVAQAHADLRQHLAPGSVITYAPLLQGNAPASQVVAGVKKTVALSGKPSLWRRGVVAAATWPAVAALAEPAPPPPPPPPPEDCAEVEAQLASCIRSLEMATQALTAKQHEIDLMTENRDRLVQELADAATEISTITTALQAAEARLESYTQLRAAIGVLYDEIRSIRPD